MILRHLLLIRLTCCVCAGPFVVNVTQSSFQVEEKDNITLEWMLTTKADSFPNSIKIYCEVITDHKAPVLFYLHGGVEVPESQDEQFAGRVQCDKDVLREGRFRLHVSRLRTEDSGLYLCEVKTRYGLGVDGCHLNVTGAVRDQSEPERPNTARDQPDSERPNTARDQPDSERPNTARDQPDSERPNTASRGRIGLYCSLGLTATVLLVCNFLIIHLLPDEQILTQSPDVDLRKVTAQQMISGAESHTTSYH